MSKKRNNNNILMKVSLWKMQCFCKPTKAHTTTTTTSLYTHSPFKLQNSQNGPQISNSILSFENNDGFEKFNESNSDGNEQRFENRLKSCIKKVEIGKESVKSRKRVQWVDNFGKQLVQVKEFESSDTGDTDNELENRTCSCLAL